MVISRWSELLLDRTAAEVRRDLRARRLEKVRHGAYDTAVDLDGHQRQLRLVRATAGLLKPGAVLSHGSAALLHGLPVPRARPGTEHHVWVTRPGEPRTRRTAHLVTVLDAPDPDPVVIGGLVVHSLERTAMETACQGRFVDAVAVLDAALALGADPAGLAAECHRRRGFRGIGRAREALAVADARSESVGESFSRALMHRYEVPMPELQVELRDARGVIGRVDFWWREARVVGEFDGRVKYGRTLGGVVQDPAEVVWREKLREDRLRAVTRTVVRWVMSDLFPPEAWVSRLKRALT